MDKIRMDYKKWFTAGIIPAIIAAILGLSWLLNISIGGTIGFLSTALWTLTGVLYAIKKFPKSTKDTLSWSGDLSSDFLNLGLNAAIIGCIVYLVYQLTALSTLNIKQGGYLLYFGGVIFGLLESGIISALGAFATIMIMEKISNLKEVSLPNESKKSRDYLKIRFNSSSNSSNVKKLESTIFKEGNSSSANKESITPVIHDDPILAPVGSGLKIGKGFSKNSQEKKGESGLLKFNNRKSKTPDLNLDEKMSDLNKTDSKIKGSLYNNKKSR